MASESELADVVKYSSESSELHSDPRGQTGSLRLHEFTPPGELPQNQGDVNSAVKTKASSAITYCHQHPDETIKIHCTDCEKEICTACFIKSHNGHRFSDVNVERLRRKMADDATDVTAGMDKCREMLERVEKAEKDVSERLEKARVEIGEKAEQLRKIIEGHEEKLLNDLSAMKEKRMKEIKSIREAIRRQLLLTDSYRKDLDEVRRNGTDSDVEESASGLHDRADRLLKFEVTESKLADLSHSDVTFAASNYVTDDVKKTLGKLCLKAANSLSPTHVLQSRDRVGISAVAALGDDVFVARFNSPSVSVYDAERFRFRRRVTFPRLRWPNALAACRVNSCLYASEYRKDRVHRTELCLSLSRLAYLKAAGRSVAARWRVAEGPVGLSANGKHLIVTCLKANRLQVYTTDGSLVRDVCLPAGVTRPWHAVRLSTGYYAVSQYTSAGEVSVVGVDGQVLRSYGQSQASHEGQMKYPSCLAVTEKDHVVVADRDNGRILSINGLLGSAQELALFADGGIHGPRGLCLDESRGRLYVAEFDGDCRLLVFDGVQL